MRLAARRRVRRLDRTDWRHDGATFGAQRLGGSGVAGRVMRAARIISVAAVIAAACLPAAAADLPIEPIYQARPAILVFRWTGVYIGAHLGGGIGYTAETPVAFALAGTSIAPLPTSYNPRGWLIGGQIGANYQIDSLVVGVEAQASWADFRGSSSCSATTGGLIGPGGNCTGKIDALGTIAMRLGWAFDHLLVYGKGGAAWTNDNYQVLIGTLVPAFPTLLFSSNATRWGWMAGLGVEYAFTDNWTAKIEYNYMDLGNYALTFTASNGNTLLGNNTRERVNVVKIGVNYRIGVSPILIR
jgi:outer membrane immunogenic protein